MADDFLRVCKRNYIEKITPSGKNAHLSSGYKKIIGIAKSHFENEEYQDFAGFFQEEKYLIPLWAAHMLLEYGNSSDELINSSLKVIEYYLDNPFAPEISNEEKKWLENHINLYEDKFQISVFVSVPLESGSHRLTSDPVINGSEIPPVRIFYKAG